MGILSNEELQGHLDVFSLGAAAGVCSSWRRLAFFRTLPLNALERRQFTNSMKNFLPRSQCSFPYCSYFQRLVSPSLTCRAWRSPVPSPTFLHCRSPIGCRDINNSFSSFPKIVPTRDTVQCLAVQSPLLVCVLHNGEV